MKPFQGTAEQRNTIDNESSYGRSDIYSRFYPTEKLKGMRRVPVTWYRRFASRARIYSSLRFLLYDR